MTKLQLLSKPSLLLPFAAAVLASPAALAQSHGVGIGAGVGAHVSSTARVQPSMPAQAATGMQMQAAHTSHAQATTPAVPATPATPAVPATQAQSGKATPAVPATPAAPAQPGKSSWESLDTDGNGSLSVSEASALESMAKVFPQADSDGNGELTAAEYKAWFTANAGANGEAKGKP